MPVMEPDSSVTSLRCLCCSPGRDKHVELRTDADWHHSLF